MLKKSASAAIYSRAMHACHQVLRYAALAVVGTVWLTNTAPVAASGTVNWPKIDQTVNDAKAAMSRDPDSVIQLSDRARAMLDLAPRGRRRTLTDVKLDWLEGEAHLRLNQPAKATPLIEQGLSIIGRIAPDTKLRGDLLISRGYLETLNANVASALRSYHQAYRIFAHNNDARSQAIALQSIASLYREANDLKSALKYDAQSNDIYQGDSGLSVSVHNNYGNTLLHLKRYSEAERQYAKALQSAASLNSPLLEIQILGNLAKAQIAAGNPQKADRTLRRGFNFDDEPAARAWLPQLFAVAAQSAWAQGNIARAKYYIDRSFAEDTEAAGTIDDRDAHETAYKVYKRLGFNELALQHLEALKKLDDQTSSLAASANTALMAARFDYTNQNLKIAKLQAQDLQRKITYERAHARTVRLAFISAGGVTIFIIALLSIGIVTIRRSRNEERAAKNALGETNSALAKALAAKTEFLATTSHEIRTPLNGILGMTQVMLTDPKLSEIMRDRLGVVHSAGVTMRALVDDILDVAKMETGNMTIEQAPMDACAVLQDVARVWQDQARARGLDFVLSLDGCPAQIVGDAARLRQVVFNLLSNALKFTERGTIALGGSVAETEGGKRLRITVSDTGIGIAPDKLDEVFESFRQADASTTRRFGGTGLGLAICRNLTRAMGGDVMVESRLGEGTIFTLDLPLVAAEAESGAQTEDAPAVALLIVDRNPITRAMLRALLEERAGTVEFANSLEEAERRLISGGIALALFDEATIRTTGDCWPEALAEAVRGAADGTRTAVLWRLGEDGDATALRAAGIDQIVAKPIAGPALRDALYPINAMKGRDDEDTVLVSAAA